MRLMLDVVLALQRILDTYTTLIREEEERRQAREVAERRPRPRPRRVWARPWLLRRPMLGLHEQLLQELNREDTKTFKNYLRMTPELFHEMVERVAPFLQKKETIMRKPIPVPLKLAVTLRFLASGCKYVDLFKIALSQVVPPPCWTPPDLTPLPWQPVAPPACIRHYNGPLVP